jgi:hypothetical protein
MLAPRFRWVPIEAPSYVPTRGVVFNEKRPRHFGCPNSDSVCHSSDKIYLTILTCSSSLGFLLISMRSATHLSFPILCIRGLPSFGFPPWRWVENDSERHFRRCFTIRTYSLASPPLLALSHFYYFTGHTTQCELFLRALTFGQSRKKRWMRDSILHCGCVEKMAYFHGVYRYEGNPMTRNGYSTHDAYGV